MIQVKAVIKPMGFVWTGVKFVVYLAKYLESFTYLTNGLHSKSV